MDIENFDFPEIDDDGVLKNSSHSDSHGENSDTHTILNIVNTHTPAKQIDESNGKIIFNDWSEQNIKTIRMWKANLLKSIVIYTHALYKYKSRLNFVMTFAMSLAYITTLLTAIISVLSIISKDYRWVVFAISLASLIINTLLTVLNIILKNTGWSKMVTKFSAYINKLDSSYASISNLLMLPDKMKMNAVEFIKKQNKEYLEIIKSVPNLSPSDHDAAHEKYRKFIQNGEIDFSIEQKYCYQDDIVLV